MKVVRGWVCAFGLACATVAWSPAPRAQTSPAPAGGASAPRAAASAPVAGPAATPAAPPTAAAASTPTTAPASTPARAPASAPRAPASAPAAAAPPSQRVEITGGRDSDTDARRRSTAAKIVIGREEIEKFGDASVAEVLRRLPGVTTPGAPGRGGPPRLRGLGSGYTQLLIDGQRLPPGFSLDALTPEQIERIEILRAPTAETGARAIAGTINIITREGFRRRLNDVRLGSGYENGGYTPGLNAVRNDSVDDLIYNVSLSVFRPHRLSDGSSETLLARRDTGTLEEQALGTLHSEEKRTGVALTTRLQWRLSEGGDNLVLMPHLFHNEGRTDRDFTRTKLFGPPDPQPYDSGTSDTTSHFTSARLNGQWRQRLGPAVRMELQGGAGLWRSAYDTQRNEFQTATGSVPTRVTDDYGTTRERSLNLTAKFSGVAVPGARSAMAAPGAPAAAAAGTGEVLDRAGGPSGPFGPAGSSGRPAAAPAPAPPAEHSLVGGLEVETIRRNESRRYTDQGALVAPEFGDSFEASTLRLAGYLQDEWNLNAHWAFHAGLRWEGIQTQGDAGDGTRPTNRSSVTTPLVHLLWKPDPARRDQVRLSLTRSYRAPTAQSLIARPSINSRASASLCPNGLTEAGNDPTQPDNAGNPDLEPERALGLDLAFERYLEGGGVLSANTFVRRVSDLIRRVTTLETVSWSACPRYVAREQNIGDATTMGLELEAKYRLDQLVADAARVELRHNVAFYRSRVQGIAGPDNRLDQQSPVTANFGADYRLRSLPLTLGGNLNVVPGYRTQLADDRAVSVSGKRVFDLFALWTFNPEVGLRLLANNLAPRDYATRNEFDFDAVGSLVPLRETGISRGPSYTNWQLRLELRL
ncbi:MAG: TonB-dependent receptor [Rubrivivax sp.]|nr:TonB-dependent receptor [Rubrivivax sp.]